MYKIAEIDEIVEVIVEYERPNRTLHGLSNGLAYYDYEGVHFRVFNSFKDGLKWMETRDESWVVEEFEDEQDLDDFLEKRK